MDEISALDSESERLITDAIANLKKVKYNYYCHRLSTVEQAIEILVLQNGEIVERGKHSQLILSEGPYFQLYRNQFDFDDGAVNIDAESNSNLLVKMHQNPCFKLQAWYENSLCLNSYSISLDTNFSLIDKKDIKFLIHGNLIFLR